MIVAEVQPTVLLYVKHMHVNISQHVQNFHQILLWSMSGQVRLQSGVIIIQRVS